MIDLQDVLKSTGGRLFRLATESTFSGFCFDSRMLETDTSSVDDEFCGTELSPMFVAIKTPTRDGHEFILDAVNRGAKGVLCHQCPKNLPQNITCVVVPDTTVAISDYAAYILRAYNPITIAVTGSNGKTTTKEAVALVLEHGLVDTDGYVFKNPGSFNGVYGLPISLGFINPQHRVAVLELAAYGFDDILQQTALTKPTIGIITSIDESHIAFFGTQAAIAQEKGRLIEGLPPQGIAILNTDSMYVDYLATRTEASVITIGENSKADARAINVHISNSGISFTVQISPRVRVVAKEYYKKILEPFFPTHENKRVFSTITPFTIQSKLLGRHQIPSILAAIAVGIIFGISPTKICRAISSLEPLSGRLCLLPGRSNCLILDDSYSANLTNTLAALDTLALFSDHHRIVILGDLDELDPIESDVQQTLGKHIAKVAHHLIVRGDSAYKVADVARSFGLSDESIFVTHSNSEVIRYVKSLLSSIDFVTAPVLLIKGDRAARMELITTALLEDNADSETRRKIPRRGIAPNTDRITRPDRPTWLEIDLESIGHNIDEIRSHIEDGVSIAAVLKADAYGHGAVRVARTALNHGVTMLCVACLAEGVTLRRAGISVPILVLGFTPGWQARKALLHDISTTIYDIDVARAFSRAAQDLNRHASIHIKVDTGMGRLGLFPNEVVTFTHTVTSLPRIDVEGIYTHFSTADSKDKQYTLLQLHRFQEVIALLDKAGHKPRLVHAANSAAALSLKESHFNMVRIGIAIYGLPPSDGVSVTNFRPALTWHSQIAQVKEVPSGSFIGYGNAYRTTSKQVIAVIPVGYADGFRRSPKNWDHVLVRGQKASVVGNVCMDQSMIDVTHIESVQQGDLVTLIGKQGNETITVEQVAKWLGTINYEVVSEILARVPRIV